MAVDDHSVRVRLEGRLELLEAARSRYRLLQLKVLGRLRWRQAARQQAALLRELADVEPRVEEALAAVFKRARSEGWGARSEAVHCANEVTRLRDAVGKKLDGLLSPAPASTPLGERLLLLERTAVHAPRLVLPGQRMSTAVELLPATLPELKTVASFGALLERIFKRPDGLGRALPFEPGELEALEEAWPRGEAALAAAWSRISAIDAAGTLTRYLQRLSRRMPMHAAKNGAEELLHTEFWKTYGLSRLTKLVSPRVSPLAIGSHELFPVARWLFAVERDDRARLAVSGGLTRPRAALFELAWALTAVSPGEDFPSRAWDRLEALAAAADDGPREGDAEKLADNLRLLLRVLAQSKRARSKGDEGKTLLSLVGALREQAAVG
jgi:hypothetical protein